MDGLADDLAKSFLAFLPGQRAIDAMRCVSKRWNRLIRVYAVEYALGAVGKVRKGSKSWAELVCSAYFHIHDKGNADLELPRDALPWMKLADKVVKAAPHHHWAWRFKAEHLEKQEKLAEAADCYSTAYELLTPPSELRSHYAMKAGTLAIKGCVQRDGRLSMYARAAWGLISCAAIIYSLYHIGWMLLATLWSLVTWSERPEWLPTLGWAALCWAVVGAVDSHDRWIRILDASPLNPARW